MVRVLGTETRNRLEFVEPSRAELGDGAGDAGRVAACYYTIRQVSRDHASGAHYHIASNPDAWENQATCADEAAVSDVDLPDPGHSKMTLGAGVVREYSHVGR